MEVICSNPVEALIFFRLLLSNCLNWKISAMIILHFHVGCCWLTLLQQGGQTRVTFCTQQSCDLLHSNVASGQLSVIAMVNLYRHSIPLLIESSCCTISSFHCNQQVSNTPLSYCIKTSNFKLPSVTCTVWGSNIVWFQKIIN